jgi:proteasome accessory factor B
VEPFGIYSNEGRWYLVALDRDAGQKRVFTLARVATLAVNPKSPATPDFELPEGFDVAAWTMLPFQIGPREALFAAVIRFEPESAWRAQRLSAGRGELAEQPDRSVVWTVPARNAAALARWLVENGPGLTLEGPPEAVAALIEGLGGVVRTDG